METVRSPDGTEIAFQRSGEGPMLVLIVGAFNDRASTNTLASGLSDAFTVYEYDRRGRGNSGDTPPYSVRREVEDLAAVIEAAGEPAFVFGHSSGAALALEAAATAVPIRALAVYEPPYTGRPNMAFAERLEKLVGEGELSEAAATFLELLGTPPSAVQQMKEAPHWAHMEKFAPSLSYEIRLCNDGELPVDRLANIDVPTLALAGETSPPWAKERARALARIVRNGQARVLQGQSHRVADDVLIPLLKEFFL